MKWNGIKKKISLKQNIGQWTKENKKLKAFKECAMHSLNVVVRCWMHNRSWGRNIAESSY